MDFISIHKGYVVELCTCLVFFLCNSFNVHSQTTKGKVYAFKNLELKNIKVKSQKSGNVVFTSANGSFSIQCHPKDKIIFSGQGFERTAETYTTDSIFVKMIFKGGSLNKQRAISNLHVNKDQIDQSIEKYSAYNCYPCPSRIFNSYTNKYLLKDKYTLLEYKDEKHMQTNYKYSLSKQTSFRNNHW